MTFFSIATPNEGEKSLTVMYQNGDIVSIPDNHPNFEALVTLLNSGDSSDEAVQLLVNTLQVVGEKMARVSERITVSPWGVFFDGDPLRGELSDTILRLHAEGDDKALHPLVAFMEKASTNPNISSIDALYRWITMENLTITETGDFIGYKGVLVEEDGSFKSIHGGASYGRELGKAMVDGVVHEGQIPYPVGAVVEMPRSEVDPNSSSYCSVGLHVGTWDYAKTYARQSNRAMIMVQVNPRDVVMVPGDSNEKMRVCRYVILNAVEEKVSAPLVADTTLRWKKGQMIRISTSQGLTRVFAEGSSDEDRGWLDGAHVREVMDIFSNGRNSKGHFVKGFKPEGLTRDSKGKWVKEETVTDSSQIVGSLTYGIAHG